jgi:hypothetical protein
MPSMEAFPGRRGPARGTDECPRSRGTPRHPSRNWRGNAPDVARVPETVPGLQRYEPKYRHFRFDMQGLNLADFHEVWLFGVEDETAQGLRQTEIAARSVFMDVAATDFVGAPGQAVRSRGFPPQDRKACRACVTALSSPRPAAANCYCPSSRRTGAAPSAGAAREESTRRLIG